MKWIQSSLWLGLACLLTAAQIGLGRRDHPGTERSPIVRLMGPASDLGRSLQWIRFQRAKLHGDQARALDLAESALALDPTATDGWYILATHLGYTLASPEREHDLERRRMWLEAALEVTRQGALQAADPAELHTLRAVMLISKIDYDPSIDERGAEGLQERARQALQQAADLGNGWALELLKSIDE